MSWDPGPPLTRRERRALQEALRKDGARRMVRDFITNPWAACATFVVTMALLMLVAVVFGP